MATTSRSGVPYVLNSAGQPIGTVYIRATDAETSAGVTPTNYAFYPGDTRRYGGAADDSTDNAEAIAAAIAQMQQPGGAPVYFCPGVHRTSETIWPEVNGWEIRGGAWYTTVVKFTAAVDGVVMGARYGKLSGIWFQGNSVGLTGLIAYDANSCVVEHCYFGGWTTDGGKAQEGYDSPAGNSNSVVLRDTTFNGNTGCGFRFVEPTGGNDQNAWEIDACSMSGNTVLGLLLRGFSHRIMGGIYDANGGDYGIQLGEDGDAGSTVSNLIFRPYLENHDVAGVMGSAKSLKNWIVLDNLNANSGYSGHANAEDILQFVDNSSGPRLTIGTALRALQFHAVMTGTTRVQFAASGSEANIPLWFLPKGTGNIALDPFASSGVIIGGQAAVSTAALQVDSTTRVFLPPRMTGTQRDAISSPADGSIIYNSTTDKVQVRAAGSWVDLH